MFQKLYFLFIFLLLTSCSTIYKVDPYTYKTESFDERIENNIKFIILHYTALSDARSIIALTKNNVSSHYLILKKNNSPVYSIVPNEKKAWHAGQSAFANHVSLNDTSIGIEISGYGYNQNSKRTVSNMEKGIIKKNMFYSYKKSQIHKVGMLLQELTRNYNINPKYILAHSDISPSRKVDPGPKFPWKYLYDKYGVGAWYDDEDYKEFYSKNLFSSYSITDLKNELRRYGYDINTELEWDKPSTDVIKAFQMHFRCDKITGEFDLETFAILKALNKKYP